MRLYRESITDDEHGLRILLAPEDPGQRWIRITFINPVAYQNVNETYRGRTWSSLQSRGVPCTLLLVRNSSWVTWLTAESNTLLEAYKFMHYGIYTVEDVIDVIALEPPTVEWIDGEPP